MDPGCRPRPAARKWSSSVEISYGSLRGRAGGRILCRQRPEPELQRRSGQRPEQRPEPRRRLGRREQQQAWLANFFISLQAVWIARGRVPCTAQNQRHGTPGGQEWIQSATWRGPKKALRSFAEFFNINHKQTATGLVTNSQSGTHSLPTGWRLPKLETVLSLRIHPVAAGG